ncbi:MAG: response regulator [Phycisphaerales bacterium]
MSQRLADTRILIVDDDDDIRTSVELAMRGEGAETRTVADGNAAIHSAQHDEPDLVILDMMLPKFSGLFVLEKIKQMDDPPIVVMMTANEGRRHMTYAEACGVDAYFYKPVPLQRLIEKCIELIDHRDEVQDGADDDAVDEHQGESA